MNDTTTTYYESAKGYEINWSRAMATLVDHGYPDESLDMGPEDPDADQFVSECWSVHAVNGQIDAQRVLDWLGY